jgi:hypothetical protein
MLSSNQGPPPFGTGKGKQSAHKVGIQSKHFLLEFRGLGLLRDEWSPEATEAQIEAEEDE